MISKILPVNLGQKEIETYALQLAEVCAKRSEVEADRKKAAGEFNQKIKAHTESIENLVSAIQEGFEERDVECDWRRNNEKGFMELVRMDTREVVETREMTEQELNQDIFEKGENEDDSDNPKK